MMIFLFVNTAVRLGLIAFEADVLNVVPWRMLPILTIGLLYDAAAAAYVVVPFALLALAMPDGAGWRRVHALAACVLFAIALFGLLCVASAEFLFWNEFSSRFNFIAVDYLIYTREVLGNIKESYPVGLLVGAVAALAMVLLLSIRRRIWEAGVADGGTPARRLATGLAILVAPVVSFIAVGDGPRDALATTAARELAGNGYYEFARAFRSNDLDFHAFYRTMPSADAVRQVRSSLIRTSTGTAFTEGAHPIERAIVATGAPRAWNVVLVTMESLGADYVGSFGGKKGLTPNLDRLARGGLQFNQIYATGLRTVRGLEALALSVPPTPGHAVLMRKNNKGLQTMGGVLKGEGYEPIFVYGGFSYFDNMQDFFGGNGYTVVDRTSIARANISHETIWGVADEDLFRQVIREIDARDAAGRKVFVHAMTTSNHRPFTYPAGRVDVPSGSGRDGAVKYADWAIGDFMREAATRGWFERTVFVFVADHTSHGRGRTDLPPENYRVPMLVYMPGMVSPRQVETVGSLIDVAPTMLSLLNISYSSRFFGHDLLAEASSSQRAFMANYLTVGRMENGMVVELLPKRGVRVLDVTTGRELPVEDPKAVRAVRETIAIYQVADAVLRNR
jgi:phosphoglycerol transferase MdoB-like AlkP superfamily enzyme